eukprot:CAMPEP_0180498546 /NCGR_PEP_ID=MMETSP1036_2-20121128/43394_1 /TAXON_ID=632150 /ORGANISM="Azadinium spinosum, Strain 3D9" /LENGTH=129 /DNA_ID=CAMNT_0022507189 /DNA_START=29 /DNA_END=415 /DNA_ORIENTATION=-
MRLHELASSHTTSGPPSLHMGEKLVRHAVILALGQLLELALAIALPVGAHADPLHTLVVLMEPGMAMTEAPRTDLVERVLVLLAMLQMRGMVLREMLEEGRAVGERHRWGGLGPERDTGENFTDPSSLS